MPRDAAAPGFRVVAGSGSGTERAEVDGFRLRPTERPAWVELGLDPAERREWRARAAEFGLSVDVWLALQAEWALVVEDVGAATAEQLVSAAIATEATPRVAPTDELRAWVAWLRAAEPPGRDDLPSVALPQRLLGRLRPGPVESELRAYARRGSEEAAISVELAAAAAGMTLEAWAYRMAARLLRTRPGGGAADRA